MGFHILQFAVMGLTERGIRVCCPVHDAVLTECRIEEIDEHADQVRRIMETAAETALGLKIPASTEVFTYPHRYMDGRGRDMFARATDILDGIRGREGFNTNTNIYNNYMDQPATSPRPPRDHLRDLPVRSPVENMGEFWSTPRFLCEISVPDMTVFNLVLNVKG
jgi:hypothetical protein